LLRSAGNVSNLLCIEHGVRAVMESDFVSIGCMAENSAVANYRCHVPRIGCGAINLDILAFVVGAHGASSRAFALAAQINVFCSSKADAIRKRDQAIK
jgi:hypothetical protein